MPGLCLTRRRTQLDLLAGACDARQRAQVRHAGTPDQPLETRLLALQPDGLLVEWPVGSVTPAELSGIPVDVHFEHLGQAYAFRSATRGRVWWHCPRRAQIAAWKLNVPLRIEARRARRNLRLSLHGLPVEVRFTRVADSRTTFQAQLRWLSGGGLCATAGGPPAGGRLGELYWARFGLPGEAQRYEFVVRVAHLRPSPRGTALGCKYCAADEPSLRAHQLERLEQYLTTRRPATASAVHAEGA